MLVPKQHIYHPANGLSYPAEAVPFHSSCWPYGQALSVRVQPMDPEEIVSILMIAALVIVWNWRLNH